MMWTGGLQEDFSIVSSMTPNLPSNGGNGLQHRSASLCSLQGEKERGDCGPAPGQSAAGTVPKKNGHQANRARVHGVRRHPPRPVACCRSTQQGTRRESDLDVDVGTSGCIDHRQKFRPQSVESINTSAAHILKRVSESWGESLATACESTAPHGWLKSERRGY